MLLETGKSPAKQIVLDRHCISHMGIKEIRHNIISKLFASICNIYFFLTDCTHHLCREKKIFI